MTFPPGRAEIDAERIDILFRDVTDSVVRHQRLVELLRDFEEAIRAETIDDLIRNPR